MLAPAHPWSALDPVADARILAAIRSAFAARSSGAFAAVEIRETDAWVTLTGQAPNAIDKYAAGEIAAGKLHVRGVTNALVVRKPVASDAGRPNRRRGRRAPG
jgi:osmotically-inducible protein OsmY